VLIVQAQPHWLTTASRGLRADVEQALGHLLVAPMSVRVARLLLYDPPSLHTSAFIRDDGRHGPSLHKEMTESLRDWLRVSDMWSAMCTEKRHMVRNRPESERYQVKSWVVAKLTDDRVAQREAELIPQDAVAVADAEQSFQEIYAKAVSGGNWADDRLLWMNGRGSALDPTVVRRPNEILAAGTARFFSVDVTTERWWGADDR
jgi:hypothetical protein